VPIRRLASGIKPFASIETPPLYAAATAANRRMDDYSLAKPLSGRSARVVFAGERTDFIRLVRRGALLELVTAGFYRFWLATDIRRVLWSGTSIEGDAAEYTGTARELLIGFLFALAMLVPIYLAYFLIGIEVERAKAFASLPLFLFFYAFGQFAIFRARRYRATRTVWRGVRFWMSGSGWAYAWRACLWTLATFFTLGLLLPWRESALERYKMRHLHYGDLPARFEGTGWTLFKRGWWLWLLSFPLITIPFVYPAYRAILWRWWIDGVRFGAVRFESALRTGGLTGLYWATIGWIVLFHVARRRSARDRYCRAAASYRRPRGGRGYHVVDTPAFHFDVRLVHRELPGDRFVCEFCGAHLSGPRRLGACRDVSHRP
jgi:uncharacterized membrane protein YjgN (DUF898 family)